MMPTASMPWRGSCAGGGSPVTTGRRISGLPTTRTHSGTARRSRSPLRNSTWRRRAGCPSTRSRSLLVASAQAATALASPIPSVTSSSTASIGSLCRHPPEGSTHICICPDTTARCRLEWSTMAVASYFGLCTFLSEYFRYLTDIQARRYLHLASYDLSLAIKLVHYEHFSPQLQRPLLPDGGKIEAALGIAALKAGHPAPDDLAGLMTARYPSDLLSSIVANLQGDKLLTTGDVWAIRDMLAHKWPPTPSVKLEFLRRPSGDTCIQGTSDSVLMQLSSCIGENLLAEISIASLHHKHPVPLAYISDLTFDSTYMETKLSRCLMETTRGASGNPGPAVDYDAFQCELILSLKMCLLDAIHALYIKALAILPTCAGESRFLRALLVSGHCYGPMDPVSNIILNSIWYDIASPPPCEMPTQDHIEAQGGILDTNPMSRAESRSLDGLVAILCSTSRLSEHEVLEYLYFWNCDLSRLCREIACSNIPFTAAAKAARHPQYLAFGSFLKSLSPEKLTHLHSLLQAPAGGRISHAHWIQLTAILYEESVCNAVQSARTYEAPCYLSDQATLEISRKKRAFRDRLTFVRTELNKVLHKYCNQHPWEPRYQLDIICGVHESRSFRSPRFYHANFLASRDAAAADGRVSLPRERTLFFAEFWELNWYPEPSSPSCCPVYDYHACIGHYCASCEFASSKIVHPPSGNHSGNKDAGSIDVGGHWRLHSTTDAGDRDLLESRLYLFRSL
ncbi:uncharacterized protein C2845_PM01G39010 [Panicum miliaceum]|uniref:Uncharacterized protein n=1 Tax=Panicum miliaceum TaxID=4540 RepID=A0A3L6TT56_PANMI|nr:uncharacterized protein C2845_PM01G39010 [Panicum miliaceum]